MNTNKFNYQVVYIIDKIVDEMRVVFVGTTSMNIDDLLNSLDETFDVSVSFYVESISYGPVNNLEDVTPKKNS